MPMQYTDKSCGFKNENFHWKNFDIFLIFAQNIDCGYTLEPPRRGGSNEYPQSMFWSKNKKNRYTPPYKWGLRGYSLHGHVFLMIRKTCPCKVYPFIPHFYIVKLGFAGVYLFFLFLLQNIELRVLV